MAQGAFVRLPGARGLLRRALEPYLKAVYEYNSLISGTGYYLKPVHVVTRRLGGSKRVYVYYGRYWWRVVYAGKRGKTSLVRWIYLGTEKPPGLPDPPRNPLEGVSVILEGDDVLVPVEHYERLAEVLRSCCPDAELPSTRKNRPTPPSTKSSG